MTIAKLICGAHGPWTSCSPKHVVSDVHMRILGIPGLKLSGPRRRLRRRRGALAAGAAGGAGAARRRRKRLKRGGITPRFLCLP